MTREPDSFIFTFQGDIYAQNPDRGWRDEARLPWQRYIFQSKYGHFRSYHKVTYPHTKNEGVLKFFISTFESLIQRTVLKDPHRTSSSQKVTADSPQN